MIVSTVTIYNRAASRVKCIERDIKITKKNKTVCIFGMTVGQPGAGDPVICSAGSVEGTDHIISHRLGAGRKEVSVA